MRRSEYSIDMYEYKFTSKGFAIGKTLHGHRGLTSGVPGPWTLQTDELPALRVEPPKLPRGGRTPPKRKGKRNA